MRKERERSSNFKSKAPKAKKFRKQPQVSKKAVDVKVNIGAMFFWGGKLISKRNTSLPLTMSDLIGRQ